VESGLIGWLSHAPLALLYLIMAAFAAVHRRHRPRVLALDIG